jgi:hypothetical protein
MKCMKWISIEEKLPKIGTECIVSCGGVTQWMCVIWDGKEFVWADEYEYGESAFDPFPSEEATHWMPFPKGPVCGFPPALI